MIKETFSETDTRAFGEMLGRKAVPGTVYTLTGDLGVGKTVFTQGFAKGLGVTEHVNSPTFTIVQEYEDGPFLTIISTCTVSAISRKSTKSAIMIISMERASA